MSIMRFKIAVLSVFTSVLLFFVPLVFGSDDDGLAPRVHLVVLAASSTDDILKKRLQADFDSQCKSVLADLVDADYVLVASVTAVDDVFLVSNALLYPGSRAPLNSLSQPKEGVPISMYDAAVLRSFVFINTWPASADSASALGASICREYERNFEDGYFSLLR